ncbi:MAG: TVP38/TMEM64 family protein [Pseudolabrys sp.]
MSAIPPGTNRARSLTRRLAPLVAVVLLAGAAYFFIGRSGISLEALIKHRMAIDAFVGEHRVLAVLAYVALYTVAVALSVPGAVILTVTGGFLFGVAVGASAAVIGATLGATLIFLVARTALGEPLLRRAGPRAAQLAQGFREDAFSYLLFLRLVPAFPFFLVNLVPALAGVRLAPFVAATVLGIIPGAVVYAFAGTGLDSVIAAQQAANRSCLAAGRTDCHMVFDAKDVLTPQLIGALIALGLLALVPVVVKRLRARSRAPM